MKHHFIFIVSLLLSIASLAQTNVTGPTSVAVGQNATYTIDRGVLYSNPFWGLNGGTQVSSSVAGTKYTVVVNWVTGGTGKVSFLNNYAPVSYLDVTVTGCTAPANPSASLQVTQNLCGPKTISYSENPPSGVTWYWQTTSSGQDVSNSTKSMVVSSSQTYYVRAKSNCGSSWSVGTNSVPVTINSNPVTGAPSVSNNSCGDKTLTRPDPPLGSGITYYWQGTDNLGTLTSNANKTFTVSNVGTSTIYLRAFSGTCWGTSTGTSVTVVSSGPPYCGNEYLNWAGNSAYTQDATGNPVLYASTRLYTNGMGGELQAQYMDVENAKILASQMIADQNGQPAIQTLPAPITSSTFVYNYNFISNQLGQPYSHQDFDKAISSNALGEVNNPHPVYASGSGTLGWYYSTQNTLEPQTPKTNFPYSRLYNPNVNSTYAARTSPGDDLRMGTGHEATAERFPLMRSELAHYYSLQKFFVEPSVFENNLIANADANTTSTFSPNQNVTITSTVSNYETYAKIVTNQSTSTPGAYFGGTFTVVPGKTYLLRLKGYSIGHNCSLWVRSGSTNVLWPGATLPQGAQNEAWIENTFTIPTGITSITVGILFAGNPPLNSQIYVNAVSFIETTADSQVGYKTIIKDPNGVKNVKFEDFVKHPIAHATLTGTSTYSNWNYAYYDLSGKLIATVSPNGVNQASTSLPQYVTRYKYDNRGRVIEKQTHDQGNTKYIYSADGRLRFSQNELQRNASPQRFSYSNYDRIGRLIESGEYTAVIVSGQSTPFTFEQNIPTTPQSVLYIVEDIGFSGITKKIDPANRCSSYSYLDYDLPATDFPSSGIYTQQTYLAGRLSRSENQNQTIWYSYDQDGKIDWIKTNIVGLGVKTLDYNYDFVGNVVEMAFQKGSSDAFHHHYVYDKDHRLKNVSVTTNGVVTSSDLRANYLYYLHGPLKRIEFLNGLQKIQGIDYLYTANGTLKAINSGDPDMDPGKDGISGTNVGFPRDAFGETIHFSETDYQGTGYTANQVDLDNAVYPRSFTDKPRAISYNNATKLKIGAGANARQIFGYKYDAYNRLVVADLGELIGATTTPNFTVPLKEDIKYDLNGNINELNRKSAGFSSEYDYVYTSGTNRLSRVDSLGISLRTYSYDDIGQITDEIRNGGDGFKYKYNAQHKIVEIRNSSNILLESFTYDNAGFVLKSVIKAGQIYRTFYYMRDLSGRVIALYEDKAGTLTSMEYPVYGYDRVGIYKPSKGMFYEVTDHVGSVRSVIGPVISKTFLATIESERNAKESRYFQNLTSTRQPFILANHTPDSTGIVASKVSMLTRDNPVGPAFATSVSPGDVINANVWAYYELGNQQTPLSQAVMISKIAAAFGGVQGAPGESGKTYDNVNSGFTGRLGSTLQADPGAFLLAVVFDKNFNVEFSAIKRVPAGADGTKTQLTGDQLKIEKPGYVYLCLFYHSDYDNPVYFDDFSVTINNSPIVFGSDYNPFGLAFSESKIEDENYRHTFQGKSAELDTTIRMNRFKERVYDPKFGRWLSPDPKSQFFSPYIGMGNMPNVSFDPDGGISVPALSGQVLPEFIKVGFQINALRLINSASQFVIASCKKCGEWRGLELGTVKVVDGETYILLTDDPTKEDLNWARVLDPATVLGVEPDGVVYTVVSWWASGVNVYVDVVSTVIVTTRNGFTEMAYGQGKYYRWPSLGFSGEEGFYLNETSPGKDANLWGGEKRMRELATNTVQLNASIITSRIPAMPVSFAKPWLQRSGNWLVKQGIDGGVGELSDFLFSVHK